MQNAISSSFGENSITSFIILSDIEKRIKEKIERVGTPLKDWDINIYRGILTGYNEAFIIDGKTKEELIEKSPKNAEIIRPILRGRDIKRYGYEFADLWLICTHNGTPTTPPINIEDFPDIKAHLDKYYKQLSERQDKGRTLYNLRSCIYMDDFSKQKIVWKRVGSILRFGIDLEGCVTLDSTCFATGNNLKYLVGVLSSKLGNYMLQDSPRTGTGDLLISVQAIEPIRIPIPNSEQNHIISEIVDKLAENESNIEYNDQLNKAIYNIYNIDSELINFIELQ